MDDQNRIRIKEAILHAKSQGKKIKMKDLAQEIFPGTTPKSAVVCLDNVRRGDVTTMDRTKIVAVCRELEVDANLLFDTPPMKPEDQQEDLI